MSFEDRLELLADKEANNALASRGLKDAGEGGQSALCSLVR
jgi:hypothetical protein